MPRLVAVLALLVLAQPALGQSSVSTSLDRRDRIEFSASDSLVISGPRGGKMGRLFGRSRVQSDDVELGAYKIEIDFSESELQAEGLATDTGLVGRPAFKSGQEEFEGMNLSYNLDSQRGRVLGAKTAIGEGYVFGGVAKQASDSVLYIKDAMYTTCNIEGDPHYHVRAGRMKIVNGEWIYTGPLHLRILNVPLPVWLPFGFLPAKEGRRSGPLPPSVGEDSRGFFMRDFGWYFAMSDYTDFQVRLGVWTGGSFEIAPLFRYAKRYHFSGQVGVDGVRNIRGLSDDPDFVRVDTWSLRASHDHTLGQSASLTSRIDFSTSDYLRTASRDYIDNVKQTIGSDVQFNKRWRGRTFTAYLNQRQILSTGEVEMRLPRLSFNQQTFRPFGGGSSAGTGLLETITVAYRGGLTNTYTFERDTMLAGSEDITWWDALWDPAKYTAATGKEDRFDFRVEHQVPIAANFRINRLPGITRDFRLNLGTRFNYQEDWYLRSELQEYDPETDRVEVSSVNEFTAIRQFSTSVNANTELYGTFNTGLGPYRALRHILRPGASMTFRPDFSSDSWGYYRSYIDGDGNEVRYPIVPDVRSGEQATLSLNLGNVLQAKRASSDTLGAGRRGEVSQLLALDFSMSHNFAADSVRWSPLSMSARTRLLNQFDFNLNARFSPYRQDSVGRTIDEFNSSLLRLTNLGFTMRTSISGGRSGLSPRPYSGIGGQFGQTNDFTGQEALIAAGQTPFTADLQNTPTGYADFSIPWSIAADLTYNISKTGTTTSRRAIMNVGFDFNVTPKWKIHGRSGYDFEATDFVTTNITILRDFHDWEMGFNWRPFGRFASYQFSLKLKTGPLRDILKLQVPQSDIPDRFGQLTN